MTTHASDTGGSYDWAEETFEKFSLDACGICKLATRLFLFVANESTENVLAASNSPSRHIQSHCNRGHHYDSFFGSN